MAPDDAAGTKRSGGEDDDAAATMHDTAIDVTGETTEKSTDRTVKFCILII